MNEQELLELYRKFEHLKNCSKKQEKINCLQEYQHDTLFVFVLEFLINTHKKTGISDSKLRKDLSDKQITLIDSLDKIQKEFHTTTNELTNRINKLESIRIRFAYNDPAFLQTTPISSNVSNFVRFVGT